MNRASTTRSTPPVRSAPSTVERTLDRGPQGPLGWADLVDAPGEGHHGEPLHRGAAVLASVVHLTDLHLCDAESPARLEHLDHHGDPGAPYADHLGLVGTYRPQEILTVQVAAAALGAVQRLAAAPVTGVDLDAVLVTGDVTDNAQRNELRWYTELMAGQPVAPWSGHPHRSAWVGSRGAGGWWPHFWHPDGAPAGCADDHPTARYGYPRVPGLVEAARVAVTSPGAGLPVLTVAGNHDTLLQGTVAVTAPLRALATGAERVVGLAPGQTPLVVREATSPVGPARYTHAPTSPRVAVPADGERDPVDPVGPGYWARDVGQVRFVALDTVNPFGGWQGSVDAPQLAWLAEELDRSAGRYVVVTSHHPSWTLTNGYAPSGAPERHLGADVLALLLRHRGVVAWVAGHVHAHSHRWHQAPDRAGGLWEVTTSSLVDWPQQLRVLELAREPGGTLALVSTVVDHLGPATWSRDRLGDPANLAALSRALGGNDYRGRGGAGSRARPAGRAGDRNAVWRLPDPHV
ncbi:metallophosphoesterase [Actinotalea sp. K2]|uniref:metallophosphoesterase n=1 Tax=Actinotalea sp. K2 TaxID=2939438 RepID=UPI002017D009|nr:metallophosphoesterase [Actinotalea sp. K2]MCL3861333.1 metallophosphoesterase [Actinotalea sp. K2]